jgi:uncharacterized protein (TIRG00374 family)
MLCFGFDKMQDRMNNTMKSVILRLSSILFRYGIGVGIIAYLYQKKQIDFSVLRNIDSLTVCVVLALCIVQLIFSAWRVKMLLASHQIFVSFARCAIYNAVGIFYSTLLPGAMSGDAFRAYYFWQFKEGIGAKSALIAALISDRLIGTLSLLFVGLVAATLSAKMVGITQQGLMVCWLIFIVGICLYLMICRNRQSSQKTAGTRFAFIVDACKHFLSRLDLRIYPPAVLWGSVVLSVLIQIFTILVVFIFAEKLKAGLNFWQVMAVSPIGFLVNTLPVSPGGLGVGEGSFEVLFAMLGGQSGGNVFLLSRIFLFSPAILGLIFALRLEKKKKTIEFYQAVV